MPSDVPRLPAKAMFDPGEVPSPYGHPTAPGDLDKWTLRAAPTKPSPGNGFPGRPRISPGMRHGPGIPGPTPTGPMSPGVGVKGEPGDYIIR